MPQELFLSDGWIQEARAIRAKYAADANPGLVVRMNLVIDGVPFGPGSLDAYVDTSEGDVDIELGHLDKPDVTVTLDYATARAVLVEGDAQAAMQAFMIGKVRVEGDMTKLLAFQATPPSERQAMIAKEIRAITAAS